MLLFNLAHAALQKMLNVTQFFSKNVNANFKEQKMGGNFIFSQSFFFPFTVLTDTDTVRYVTRAGGAMNWDWLRLEHCSW